MIGCLRVRGSSQRKGWWVGKALLLAFLLVTGISRLEAAELWDFIQVRTNYAAAPKWETRNGKARVEFQGNRIEIRAYYDGYISDAPGDASIVISGTLDPDHGIKAKYTLLNSDARPVELTGRYMTREELQIWGTKRKIVTRKEIVFAHPPNSEFFGFLGRGVRDD